jgi:hypothetical protein
MAVGSAVVMNARRLMNRQLARFKATKKVTCTESVGEHPVRPTGQRTQQALYREGTISTQVEPVGEGVDVICGETLTEPSSSYR